MALGENDGEILLLLAFATLLEYIDPVRSRMCCASVKKI
jgi:hypothetical protein